MHQMQQTGYEVRGFNAGQFCQDLQCRTEYGILLMACLTLSKLRVHPLRLGCESLTFLEEDWKSSRLSTDTANL